MFCNLRLQCTLDYYLFTSRLGMKAYDYCGSPFMAVRAAQKFYPQFSNTQLSCTDGSKLHLGNQLLLKKNAHNNKTLILRVIYINELKKIYTSNNLNKKFIIY